LATTSVPRLPPAPARFSMTMVCFSPCEARSPTMRANTSGVEPAANGTTRRIGLFG
jgi:hypothetical protein